MLAKSVSAAAILGRGVPRTAHLRGTSGVIRHSFRMPQNSFVTSVKICEQTENILDICVPVRMRTADQRDTIRSGTIGLEVLLFAKP